MLPNCFACPIKQILNSFYIILAFHFKHQVLYTCKLTSLSHRKSTQVRKGAFYSFLRENAPSCASDDFQFSNSVFKFYKLTVIDTIFNRKYILMVHSIMYKFNNNFNAFSTIWNLHEQRIKKNNK